MKRPDRRQAKSGPSTFAVPNHSTAIRFSGTKNPRYLRALRALLNGRLTREQLDRIAGCSNGPALIIAIRKLGLSRDDLRSDEAKGVDRDGRRVTYGVYSLSPEARRAIRAWLRTAREVDE